MAISRAPMRPDLAFAANVVAIGVSDIRQRKFAPRASLVPFFASAGGVPTFTVKPIDIAFDDRLNIGLFPEALLDKMNVEASGTST